MESKHLKRGIDFGSFYHPNFLRSRFMRLAKDKPSRTVITQDRSGKMYIHPTQPRSLTLREFARLQSFPDTFMFPVTRKHQMRLIGNAVPPLLAKRIGHGIINLLAALDS